MRRRAHDNTIKGLRQNFSQSFYLFCKNGVRSLILLFPENRFPLLHDGPILEIINPHRLPHAAQGLVGGFHRFLCSGLQNIIDSIDVSLPSRAFRADRTQSFLENTDQEFFAGSVAESEIGRASCRDKCRL